MEARQQNRPVQGRGPGGHGMRNVWARPKNTKETLKRILSYFGEHKFKLIFVFACIIISSMASVSVTYLIKPLTNNYIIPMIGIANPDMSGFLRTLAIMGGLQLISVIATYAYARTMMVVSTGTLLSIRKQLFGHMEKLSISYFDKHPHGELMSYYTNDVDTMREMISQGIPQFINSVIRLTSVFIMMLALSWQLTLLALVTLFAMFMITKALGKRSGKYFRKRQESIGKVNGYIEEMIEGQKVVKVFCHEEKTLGKFEEINVALRENTALANTWASVLMPISGNIGHIQYAMTAMAGGLLTVLGYLDIGTIAAFLEYSRNFVMPITQLTQQFNSILSAIAGAERIFGLMDEPVEEDEGDVELVNVNISGGVITESETRTGKWAWKVPLENGEFDYIELKGDVRFNNVSFSYDKQKPVIRDMSLFAKPGQKIAFVGSTGAGKTTITNLINRFYDIDEGEILYDGIPIRSIKKAHLRGSLGMVLQDTHLFTGTVMENIRYGKLDATDEEVIAAAKLANADFFISHLPQGYGTMITGDGANLSQGQRQLLGIARAAVADPPVLILDEATSSIDTRTEALIEKGMDELMNNRTVFVIAHRLSTVRNSKAIMVMENGEIIERGNHEDLLKLKGRYYQLYTGMFELS